MESLQLQLNDNLSINDLNTLQAQGYSLLRSAHVGNLSPYNLALAEAGIPMLLVDHNVTGVDKSYFPEFILSQDGPRRIAEDGTVSLRTLGEGGQFLDEQHITALGEAFPNATIFTNSEYIRRNESISGEIARLAVRNFPSEFERIVNPDGRTRKMGGVAELVSSMGIMQLNDDPRAEKLAVLMPNMLNIIINFVVEALESERDVQYHVSGSAMALYVQEKRIRERLQSLYEIIKREASFGGKLPDQLTVELVPAVSARFATSSQYQPELSGLFEQLDASRIAVSALTAERKAFFTKDVRPDIDAQRNFESTNNQRQFAADRAIVKKAEQVPGLFTPTRDDMGFVTQYDVLQAGGLFVASQNREQTFGELATLVKRLAMLRKRTRL